MANLKKNLNALLSQSIQPLPKLSFKTEVHQFEVRFLIAAMQLCKDNPLLKDLCKN